MPSFTDAVLVTLAGALSVLVGKAQSRPSGRSREDLAWGMDLLVAAITLQVGALVKVPDDTIIRLCYLAALLAMWILYTFTIREFGCYPGTDTLKQSAVVFSCGFGIVILTLCYLANLKAVVRLLY